MKYRRRMTRGLKRYHHSAQSHFVTFSCYRRLRHLNSTALRDLFIKKLEQTRVRFGLRVYGFVAMPEHVHLLVSEPARADLATALRSLKVAVSAESKNILGLANVDRRRFWQARYYDLNVRDHEQFVEKLQYIHRNPVKRGLVGRPEDWKWSSFRHYSEGVDVGVEIESERTARKRSGTPPGPPKPGGTGAPSGTPSQ